MTLYEIIALSQGISSRIDIQWSLFITVHLAIFGGIIYVDRPLRMTEKWVALFIYTGFSLINWTILRLQFDHLLRTYQDVISVAGDGDQLAMVEFYKDALNTGLYQYVNFIIFGAHLVMFVVVILSVAKDSSEENSMSMNDRE